MSGKAVPGAPRMLVVGAFLAGATCLGVAAPSTAGTAGEVPGDCAAAIADGAALLGTGNPSDAATLLGRALPACPGVPELKVLLGMALLDQEPSRAAIELEEAARAGSMPAASARAALLLRSGAFEEAQSRFAALATRNPKDREPLLGLAVALFALGRREEASEAAVRAARTGRIRLEEDLRLLDPPRMARDLLETALRTRRVRDPASHRTAADLWASTAYARSGLPAREAWVHVVHHLETLLQASPRDEDVRRLLGQAYTSMGELTRAERVHREGVALEPGSSLFRLMLAASLSALGRHAEALPHYEAVLAAQPDQPDILSMAGQCHRSLGDGRDLELFRRAAALRPDRSLFLTDLGDALLARNRFAEAEGPLRRAVELDPGNRAAQFKLALALRQQGKTEEAAAVAARSRRLLDEVQARLEAEQRRSNFASTTAAAMDDLARGAFSRARLGFERVLSEDAEGQPLARLGLAAARLAEGSARSVGDPGVGPHLRAFLEAAAAGNGVFPKGRQ